MEKMGWGRKTGGNAYWKNNCISGSARRPQTGILSYHHLGASHFLDGMRPS
jgi:hypothetical protein